MRRYIFVISFLIFLFLIIPLFWSSNVIFNVPEFTQEWYKNISSFVQIFIGLVFFTFIYNEEQRIERVNRVGFLKNLLIQNIQSVRDCMTTTKQFQANSILVYTNLCSIRSIVNILIPNYFFEIVKNSEDELSKIMLLHFHLTDIDRLVQYLDRSKNDETADSRILASFNRVKELFLKF